MNRPADTCAFSDDVEMIERLVDLTFPLVCTCSMVCADSVVPVGSIVLGASVTVAVNNGTH